MTTITPAFAREIKYNRDSHDYDMLLDGQYIGSARDYHSAEITLDQLIYELLHSDITASAHDLDSGSSDEEIAADRQQAGAVEDYAECASCGDLCGQRLSDPLPAYCPACTEAGEAEIAAAQAIDSICGF